MVKYPGGKFRTLESGALIQRVVNYKAVITILGGQIAEMSVDNPLRKERVSEQRLDRNPLKLCAFFIF